jgi:carboxyl-terminal processing protease
MTSRTRLFVLLVSTPLVAFAVIGGFMGKVVAREDSYRHLRVFEDVMSLILSNYVEEVNVDRAMEGAMRGLGDGLDADTAYLTPEEVAFVEKGAAHPAGDTGLELTRQFYLRAIAARDNSPAARAGLRTGDYLRAIDGRSTRNMSVFEGTRLLRGEPGTRVALTVLRGTAAEPHEVVLVREALPATDVSGRLLPGQIGYVRVAAFGPEVATRLGNQVAALREAGATRLVVDLRATAQGSMEAALDAAQLFVRSGTLAQRETRGQGNTSVSANGAASITIPTVLLVTTGTSGPAELFAAALSGNGRAELVGERTLGRAGSQKLVKLPDGSGLWMTTLRYLMPDGNPIHGTGLEPAVSIDEPEVEFGVEAAPTDPVLEKALEHLNAKRAA